MRIWRAHDDERELFFRSISKAMKHVAAFVGEFADGYEFAGKWCAPERWEWERNGAVYTYADWTIEPVEVLT